MKERQERAAARMLELGIPTQPVSKLLFVYAGLLVV